MMVLLGALMMHGFIPGPLLIKEATEFLYASVAGLLGATIMRVLIGWPIARLLLKLVTLDRSMVLIGALLMTMIGAYATERAVFDVFLLLCFGTVGYFMMRYGYSVAGAAIGAVIGAGHETSLRAGLMLMEGDVWVFVSLRWTAVIRLVAFGLLAFGVFSTVKLARREAAV